MMMLEHIIRFWRFSPNRSQVTGMMSPYLAQVPAKKTVNYLQLPNPTEIANLNQTVSAMTI